MRPRGRVVLCPAVRQPAVQGEAVAGGRVKAVANGRRRRPWVEANFENPRGQTIEKATTTMGLLGDEAVKGR
ncbi:hypothetical protein GUJ93_ZPchr0004g39020 [Zizania palustris]|uniref:Uncharacterized protein n=1 Tax=Zizania palustris TaxID=103762 RepID=A0A8J5VNN0_ZIZPA|nr:hypothetical protein GUJ93_ZPchr0004g39020 [Zizania palustris]